MPLLTWTPVELAQWSMTVWICATCAIEHADTAEPPEVCEICADDRQWVPPSGQAWTTHEELRGTRTSRLEELEPGLFGLSIEPRFGIGQNTLIVDSGDGLVLWEPSGYLDASMVELVHGLEAQRGPIVAITASHPHLVGASVSWSRELGGVPYLFNRADERWIRRPDPAIRLWHDTESVAPGVTLVQAGGHFPGSCVLHWPGADERGVLLVGDTIAVEPDRRWVSFMRSYVNDLPLPARLVRQIAGRLDPYAYDRIYGAFGANVLSDGQAIVRASAERYIGWVTDTIRDPDEVPLDW